MPRGVKLIRRKRNGSGFKAWSPAKAASVPTNNYRSRPIDSGYVILDRETVFGGQFWSVGDLDALDNKLGLQPLTAKFALIGKAIPLMQAIRITNHFGLQLTDAISYDTFWPKIAGTRKTMRSYLTEVTAANA